MRRFIAIAALIFAALLALDIFPGLRGGAGWQWPYLAPVDWLPVVLLAGIYTGVFTPTEAAAVAALHALLLAGLVYRALGWRSLFTVFLDSTRSSAVITISAV